MFAAFYAVAYVTTISMQSLDQKRTLCPSSSVRGALRLSDTAETNRSAERIEEKREINNLQDPDTTAHAKTFFGQIRPRRS
jgi:hypothetical protein